MKKCKYCGKQFKTGYKGRKLFCSNECGAKWWANKHKRTYKKNTKCIVCGNPLMSGSYYYCSEECRKIQAKAKAMLKKEKEKKVINFFDKIDNPNIAICLTCTKKECEGSCEKINKSIMG